MVAHKKSTPFCWDALDVSMANSACHVIDSLWLILSCLPSMLNTHKSGPLLMATSCCFIDSDFLSGPIEEEKTPHPPCAYINPGPILLDATLLSINQYGNASGFGGGSCTFVVWCGVFLVRRGRIYQPRFFASSSLSMSCPFVVKGHISEIGCCCCMAPNHSCLIRWMDPRVMGRKKKKGGGERSQ